MMETGDKASNAQMEGRMAIKLIQEKGGERMKRRTGARKSSGKVVKVCEMFGEREREESEGSEVAEVGNGDKKQEIEESGGCVWGWRRRRRWRGEGAAAAADVKTCKRDTGVGKLLLVPMNSRSPET